MDKSIRDLQAQVLRIITMQEARGGWKACHSVPPTQLWQTASSIAARRGLSRFGDKDKKGAWTAAMWHTTPERKQSEQVTATQQKTPQIKEKAAQKPLTASERERYEKLLTEGVNEEMMYKVAAWIEQDIILKRDIIGHGDLLEIPRRLYTAMQRILKGHEQEKMF